MAKLKRLYIKQKQAIKALSMTFEDNSCKDPFDDEKGTFSFSESLLKTKKKEHGGWNVLL